MRILECRMWEEKGAVGGWFNWYESEIVVRFVFTLSAKWRLVSEGCCGTVMFTYILETKPNGRNSIESVKSFRTFDGIRPHLFIINRIFSSFFYYWNNARITVRKLSGVDIAGPATWHTFNARGETITRKPKTLPRLEWDTFERLSAFKLRTLSFRKSISRISCCPDVRSYTDDDWFTCMCKKNNMVRLLRHKPCF